MYPRIATERTKWRAALVFVIGVSVLASCTYAPIEATRLSQDEPALLAAVSPQGVLADGQATVRPLLDGQDALAAWLDLIDSAKTSIDLKTFIIRADDAGFLVASRLLAAADRGVRVRILLDDLFNRRTLGRIRALDRHPMIELRSFNPFSRFSPSAVGFLFDYGRVTRRMHSRVAIADGRRAIVGGRNLADEYFSDNGRSSFYDFEVLIENGMIDAFGELFESYWTDPWSVPYHDLGAPGQAYSLREEDRTLIRERAQKATAGRYAMHGETGRTSVGPLFSGPARVFADPPHKLRRPFGDGPFVVADSFFEALRGAEREVLIVTPYLVPDETLIRLLRETGEKGVAVDIVTNSLATTNHAPVHGGYARWRAEMLAGGARLHEMLPSASQPGGGLTRTLHAKFAVIDRRHVFVSTLNLDPVSVKGNAEVGLFIDDASFAEWVLAHADPAAVGMTAEVLQADSGRFEWRRKGSEGGEARTLEPEAGVLRNLIADIVRALRIEDVL